ncbi:glycosyltransferase family 2 protein [Lacibacter sp. MH-610]|uniref:glycosyltransferase family 2 protein n=1 Tax=Lacibacter sp. MH-610 TaxID=3020883 RepID=UPI0038912ECC
MADISIIVPVYNEAEFVLPFYYELKKHVPKNIELIWVDDGSTDSTLAEIEQLVMLDSRIRCISLTRNFGQVAAVSAGIDFALAATVIIMSGNLKHPPSVLPVMLKKLAEGYEIVKALPDTGNNTSPLIKGILNLYYKLIDKIAPGRNENNITSFRAFNYKVSDGIRQLKERNLFLENFFSWSGYKTASVAYHCPNCSKKDLKYSFSHLRSETQKMLQNISPAIVKTSLAGGLLLLAAAAYNCSAIINQMNADKPVNPFAIALTALTFAGSIALLIKSNYRLIERKVLQRSNRLPKYLVKDIIEQDHNYARLQYEMNTR